MKDPPPYIPKSVRCYGDATIREYYQGIDEDERAAVHVLLVPNPEAS